MTLLEYILAHYLGPPRIVRGNGVSYWNCPICEHYSFHTLPDKPAFKHRAKCWNPECEFRGDAADMLREFHPDEPYNVRVHRLEELRQEWEEVQRPKRKRRKHTLASGRGDRGDVKQRTLKKRRQK